VKELTSLEVRDPLEIKIEAYLDSLKLFITNPESKKDEYYLKHSNAT